MYAFATYQDSIFCLCPKMTLFHTLNILHLIQPNLSQRAAQLYGLWVVITIRQWLFFWVTIYSMMLSSTYMDLVGSSSGASILQELRYHKHRFLQLNIANFPSTLILTTRPCNGNFLLLQMKCYATLIKLPDHLMKVKFLRGIVQTNDTIKEQTQYSVGQLVDILCCSMSLSLQINNLSPVAFCRRGYRCKTNY